MPPSNSNPTNPSPSTNDAGDNEEAQARTTWQQAEPTFSGKRYSEYFDPCEEAAKKSMKCLHRNGGDRDLCTDYFQAYRDCKKAWMTEKREAKRKAAGGLF